MNLFSMGSQIIIFIRIYKSERVPLITKIFNIAVKLQCMRRALWNTNIQYLLERSTMIGWFFLTIFKFFLQNAHWCKYSNTYFCKASMNCCEMSGKLWTCFFESAIFKESTAIQGCQGCRLHNTACLDTHRCTKNLHQLNTKEKVC